MNRLLVYFCRIFSWRRFGSFLRTGFSSVLLVNSFRVVTGMLFGDVSDVSVFVYEFPFKYIRIIFYCILVTD